MRFHFASAKTFALAAGFLFLTAGAARARVVINAFLYDAEGADTGREWVQLFNAGASTADVAGWVLQADVNNFPGDTRAKLCGRIRPGGFYLIAEAAAPVSTSTVDLVSGTLALGNAGSKADSVQLLDASGAVQDRVVYGGADVDGLCGGICSTAPAAINGASLARSAPGAEGFLVVPSSLAAPVGGGGLCAREQESRCPAGPAPDRARISEVSPSIPGNDFIELYAPGPAALCGLQLYEGDDLIKTFPAVTLNAGPFGSFMVIHASVRTDAAHPDETDASGDRGGDGAADLFSDDASPGLLGGAADNLTLRAPDGRILDFVAWSPSDEDGYEASKQEFYDLAAASGAWRPACSTGSAAGGAPCYVGGSAPWGNSASESLARKFAPDGGPQDSIPGVAEDWVIALPTPGRGYGAALSLRGALLEVFQSPFSPSGGRFTEAVLAYRPSADAAVTLRIFDALGREVRTLLNGDEARGAVTQIATWDGRGDGGALQPMGLYVAHLEARRPDGGIERASAAIVLARRL